MLLIPFIPTAYADGTSAAWLNINGYSDNGSYYSSARTTTDGRVDVGLYVENISFTAGTFKIQYDSSIAVPALSYNDEGLTVIQSTNNLGGSLNELVVDFSGFFSADSNGAEILELTFTPQAEGTLPFHLGSMTDYDNGKVTAGLSMINDSEPVDFVGKEYNDGLSLFSFTDRDNVNYFMDFDTGAPLTGGTISAVFADNTEELLDFYVDEFGGYFFNDYIGDNTLAYYAFEKPGYWSTAGGFHQTSSIQSNMLFAEPHMIPSTTEDTSIFIMETGIGINHEELSAEIWLSDWDNGSTPISGSAIHFNPINDDQVEMVIEGGLQSSDMVSYNILVKRNGNLLGRVYVHLDPNAGNATGTITSPENGSSINALTSFTGTASDDNWVMGGGVFLYNHSLGWYNAVTNEYQTERTEECIIGPFNDTSGSWDYSTWDLDVSSRTWEDGDYSAYLRVSDGVPNDDVDTVNFTIGSGGGTVPITIYHHPTALGYEFFVHGASSGDPNTLYGKVYEYDDVITDYVEYGLLSFPFILEPDTSGGYQYKGTLDQTLHVGDYKVELYNDMTYTGTPYGEYLFNIKPLIHIETPFLYGTTTETSVDFTGYISNYIDNGSNNLQLTFNGVTETVAIDSSGRFGYETPLTKTLIDGNNSFSFELSYTYDNMSGNTNTNGQITKEQELIEYKVTTDPQYVIVGQDNSVTVTVTYNGEPQPNKSIEIEGYDLSGTTNSEGQFTATIHPTYKEKITIIVEGIRYEGILYGMYSHEGFIEITGKDISDNQIDNFEFIIFDDNMAWGSGTKEGQYVGKAVVQQGTDYKVLFTKRGYDGDPAYYLVQDLVVLAGEANNVNFQVSNDNTSEIDVNLQYNNQAMQDAEVYIEGKTFDSGTQNPDFKKYYSSYLGRTDNSGYKKLRVSKGIFDVGVTNRTAAAATFLTKKGLDWTTGQQADLAWDDATTGEINISYDIDYIGIDKFLRLDDTTIDLNQANTLTVDADDYTVDSLGFSIDVPGDGIEYNYRKKDQEVLSIEPGTTADFSKDLNIRDVRVNLNKNQFEAGDTLYYSLDVFTESDYEVKEIHSKEYDDKYNEIYAELTTPDGQRIDLGESYYKDGQLTLDASFEEGIYKLEVERDLGPVYGVVFSKKHFTLGDRMPQPVIRDIRLDGNKLLGIVQYDEPLEVRITDMNTDTPVMARKEFNPNDNLTRAQMCQILFNVLKLPYIDPGSDFYPDVDRNYWASEYIYGLTDEGIVKGYPNGYFGPEDPITRDQLAVLIAKVFKIPPYLAPTPMFSDVPADHWARPFIESLVHAGIMNGYDEDTFGVGDPVTKAQAAVVLLKAMGIDTFTNDQYFDDDSQIPDWARIYVNEALKQGLYNTFDRDTFEVTLNNTTNIKIEAIGEDGIITTKILAPGIKYHSTADGYDFFITNVGGTEPGTLYGKLYAYNGMSDYEEYILQEPLVFTLEQDDLGMYQYKGIINEILPLNEMNYYLYLYEDSACTVEYGMYDFAVVPLIHVQEPYLQGVTNEPEAAFKGYISNYIDDAGYTFDLTLNFNGDVEPVTIDPMNGTFGYSTEIIKTLDEGTNNFTFTLDYDLNGVSNSTTTWGEITYKPESNNNLTSPVIGKITFDGNMLQGIVKYDLPIDVELKDLKTGQVIIPEKLFEPNEYLQRAQISQMLFGALDLPHSFPSENVFDDIDKDHWAAEYIKALKDLDIIMGYPDGNFNPGGGVSRAQLAAMICRAFDIPEFRYAEPFFSDVDDTHWARGYIEALHKNVIMVGYPDLNFGPEDQVSRAQAVVVILRAMGIGEGTSNQYFDNLEGHWASEVVNTGLELGLYNVFIFDTFEANVETMSNIEVLVKGSDGSVAVTYIFRPAPLKGDFNSDGAVDMEELATLAQDYGLNTPEKDLNGDGIIDIYDLVMLSKNIKISPPAGTQVLKYNLSAEPDGVDPLNSYDDLLTLPANVFEGLVKLDKINDKVMPAAADSWSVSGDGLTYLFHIRDNAKWSDGEPVKAQDFVYSWTRLVDLGFTQDLVIKAVNDDLLEVKLGEPTPWFLYNITHPYFAPLREDEVEGNPVWSITNGPFIVSEWIGEDHITLIPNESYWNNSVVELEKIEFTFVDPATALSMLDSGQLHGLDNVPPSEIPTLMEEDDRFITYSRLGTYFYEFNHDVNLPVSDPRVRRALALAIDRDYITNDILMGGQIPATGFVPPGIFIGGEDFRAAGGDYGIDPMNAKVTEAQALLADAGYPGGEGLSVTIQYNTNSMHEAIAQAIEQMWESNLGINVDCIGVGWDELQSNLSSGSFMIGRQGWLGDYYHPMSMLGLWTSDSDINHTNWSDSQYDSFIEQSKTILDMNTNMDLMHDAEDILMNDMVVLPIYYYNNTKMMSKDVINYVKSPFGYIYFDKTKIKY